MRHNPRHLNSIPDPDPGTNQLQLPTAPSPYSGTGRRSGRNARKNEDRIVVVGAGIGGLSAAIHLAAAGHRVSLVEQNDTVGGKMSRVQKLGFTWDTGPSVITMRYVFDDLFAVAGRRLDDYLTLVPVEPVTRYFYPDGIVLDATRDLPRMSSQIAALNPHDVEGYLGFLAHAAALNRVTGPVFVHGDPPSLRQILRVPPADMVQVDVWRTIHTAIRRWVRDPHLQQMLGRYATYVGASPYKAPAVLNVIAHTELTEGIWYARGGIYAIAQAFERLARELGAEIHTGTRATGITIDTTGTVTGVQLEDGERLECTAAVANVDVTTVYRDLLPKAFAAKRLRRLLRVAPSISGFVLLLGLRGATPGLAQHNILFTSNYRQEFREIFTENTAPTDPTVYISISSQQDPEHAPAGCENWFVMVNAPPLSTAFSWKARGEEVRNRVLRKMATMGFDVQPRIVTETYLTPNDLQTRTGAWRGSLYGLSSNQPLNALRRPHPRDPEIRGLYFTGGTTHPGGGVPMVTLSGGVAARMVALDLAQGRLSR